MKENIDKFSFCEFIKFIYKMEDKSNDFFKIINLLDLYVDDYKNGNKNIDNELDIMCYRINGEVVGAIMIDNLERRLRDKDKQDIIVNELTIIYVKKGFRRKGIGRLLVENIINNKKYKDIIIQASILEGSYRFWKEIDCVVKGESFTTNCNRYAAYMGKDKGKLNEFSKNNPFGDKSAYQFK